MSDARTLSVYDSDAEEYADLVESKSPYPRLEAFIDAMPSGGRVLDLGCGPGNWAARMIERGLDVDALDASQGMVEIARSRFGVEVRHARFEEVSGEDAYDGIWAHYSLLHASRDAIPQILLTLARALRPGGLFLLVLKLGEGEGRDTKDRFYTYFSEAELENLLLKAGFHIESREFGESTGLAGKPHGFIAICARLA